MRKSAYKHFRDLVVVGCSFFVIFALTPVRADEVPDPVLAASLDELEQMVADHPEDLSMRLWLAKAYYFRVVNGLDKPAAAVGPFDALLTEIDPAEPDHAVATGYRGSLKLLEAKHTWAFWNKQALADRGLALMDEAVKREPDNVELRFLRGVTCRELPASFERSELSREDLMYAIDRVEESVDEGRLTPAMAAAALSLHAQNLMESDQTNEAIPFWELAAELGPETPGGVAAQGYLNQLSSQGS